jgi:hypothetical protein
MAIQQLAKVALRRESISVAHHRVVWNGVAPALSGFSDLTQWICDPLRPQSRNRPKEQFRDFELDFDEVQLRHANERSDC